MRNTIGLTASFSFILAAAAAPALADDARVHVEVGGAHAVGAPQGSELGTGGGGAAAVELPIARAVGVQAGAGAVVLPKGDAPSDPAIAQRSTATAIFGTAGFRVHPFGVGPWADANAGLAQTGSLLRPTVDAHLGWDFTVSRSGGFAAGPFVGYTQIVQPNDSLRPDDARIVWAGLSLTLGGRERPPAPPPPVRREESPPPPALEDQDGLADAIDACPDGQIALPTTASGEDGGCGAFIELTEDRIVINDIIHFEFDTAVIRKKSYGLVERIAQLIIEHPEVTQIRVEGHADARGTAVYNQLLSESRAQSTRALLVRFGVEPARLVTAGYGKSRLKVPTQLAEPENRRVEFNVVRRTPPQAILVPSRGGKL